MVAYAYDTIQRVNPLGFFGMVHVLEGTSIVAADAAAAGIQKTLNLPDEAFSYLRSHGALDQSHVKFFASADESHRCRADRAAASFIVRGSSIVCLAMCCAAWHADQVGWLAAARPLGEATHAA